MHDEPAVAQTNPTLPRELALALSRARRVFVLTGAGMSAESGIPTFRDAQTGLWANYRPEELATPEAFAENPGTVWSWYEERRQTIAKARPHAGHQALASIEKQFTSLTIATQNVDGLHQAAGSTDVHELHGNIMQSICHQTRLPIEPDWLSAHEGTPPPSPHHPALRTAPHFPFLSPRRLPRLLQQPERHKSLRDHPGAGCERSRYCR